jgi:hypothetical protein
MKNRPLFKLIFVKRKKKVLCQESLEKVVPLHIRSLGKLKRIFFHFGKEIKKGFNINFSLKTTNHYKFSLTKIILHLNVYNRYCFYRLVLFSVLKGLLLFIVPSDNIIEKNMNY